MGGREYGSDLFGAAGHCRLALRTNAISRDVDAYVAQKLLVTLAWQLVAVNLVQRTVEAYTRLGRGIRYPLDCPTTCWYVGWIRADGEH